MTAQWALASSRLTGPEARQASPKGESLERTLDDFRRAVRRLELAVERFTAGRR